MKATPSRNEAEIDPATLALAALGWILEQEDSAHRFLELTGLDPETLRTGLGTAYLQTAILEYLANHEPDLIRAAEALAVTPEEMIAALEKLRT